MREVGGMALLGRAPVDGAYAGLASGLFNTTQVVGGSLGLAVLSTLAASRTEGLLTRGAELVPATAEGFGAAAAGVCSRVFW